jgi:TP901 family phage tail tape measure protein
MSKFASTMSKQAGTAAKTAGLSAGRQFSAGVAAGGSTSAAKTLVSELEVASKRAAKAIQSEKVAIAKARSEEKSAAVGVQAAEARLAEQRKKYTASSSQALKAEQQLTSARGKQQLAGMKVVAVEDQLKAAFNEQKTVTGQLSAAQAQGSKQTALMQSRFGRLAAAGAPLSSGLGKVAAGAKNVAATALATLKPLAGMAAGFGAIIGVGQVIKLGNEYTATINELGAVTNTSGAELAKFGEKARQLGSDLTLPATSGKDAAAIMLELAKGGLTAADAMTAAKGTIQLAAAAQVDGGRAAEIQSNAINQFGLAAKDAGMVADVLANTANAAAGGVDDIATSMKYVGPVARVLGINIGDTAAAVGLLANNGLKGDTAGTALRGMMASLSAPSKQAGGAIEALGISAFDSSGKFVGMREIIQQLSEAQKTMTKEQFAANAAVAFGREPLAAVSSLASSGASAFDTMAKAVGRQGGAAAVAQSKMKGLGGAMDKLQSQLEDVALGIYQTVSPALEGIANSAAAGLDGAGDKVTKFLGIAGGLGKLAFTGKVSAPISGIDPAVVSGVQAARTVIVGAFRDISSFVTSSLVPSVKNLAAALGPTAAIMAGAFVGAFRAAAFLLANVIGPALVGVTAFMRNNKVAVTLLAGAIGGLVVAYKAWVLQQKILAAGGFAMWASQLRVVTAAQKAWTFATWLATGAQKAFNLALRMNPIGLIITAIGLLVAGVIWAYKNIGWFKTGIDAIWAGIKMGAQAVATVAIWLWKNVFGPVFRGIGAVVSAVWNNVLSPIFQLVAAIIRTTVGAVFMWLYNSVIKPVFAAIQTIISAWWNFYAKPIFTAAVFIVKNVLGPVFLWLYRNAIKPAWDGIKTAIKSVWDWLKPVFDKLADVAKNTIPSAFTTMKNGIAKAWEAVKSAAKAPIKFVVETVVNKALIGNFNKVAGFFGTKKIDKVSLPDGFARGGVIPGYQAAKRDDVMTPMRRGEGVLVPEVVRGLGPSTIHALNAAGNSGGASAVRQMTGYAKGGVVKKNSGSDGGNGNGLLAGAKAAWSWTKGAAGNAWDWTKNAAETASQVVSDPMGTLGKLVKSVIGNIPGSGGMVDAAAGMGNKLLSGAVSVLKNMGGGDVGNFGGNGKNGQLPKSALSKVTGFTGGSGVGPIGGYLRKAAAVAWEAMQRAFGGGLSLTEGYRDLANQQKRYAMYRAGGNLAATPGSSVHGLGNAADVGGGSQAWMRSNGPRFGWYPTGLSFSQREPWHFEYKGRPSGGGMAAGGIVGGLTPTLYDKGGVLPQGLSLVQNNLRDPEVALPMQTLREIVSTESGGGGNTYAPVFHNADRGAVREFESWVHKKEVMTGGR